MSTGDLRETDPLCKHTRIAVGCGECAAERAENARKREEEAAKNNKK